MDYISFLPLIFFLAAIIYVLKLRPTRLPPGPNPLPIIGNLHQLGTEPHQSLASFSKIYGSFISLKLGAITTIVVSSPEIAKDILHKHDQDFSSRSVIDSVRALDHHNFSVIWQPASDYWRNIRKICAVQIFSTQRLDALQTVRQKKVAELLSYTSECSDGGRAVNIALAVYTTVLNSLANTIFSTDLAKYESSESQEFKHYVSEVMKEAGKPNLADYIPALRLVDPQGIRRRMAIYFRKLLEIFDGIIDQRLRSRDSSVCKDALDHLLELTKEDGSELTVHDIKHLFLDLFAAGTDTTSGTLEWAMAELLHNPDKMAKARAELEQIPDKMNPIQESDIQRLPYLQAIVKETLRLHPPAPLLVPHKAGKDVEICGYVVPKNAQILFNVWAMSRDEKVWEKANSFMPERFLDKEIDFRGRDYELIPFGAGRRICPGLSLANRTIHVILGSLIRSFEWKLENEMKPEDMDMRDKHGFTLHKAEPLRAIPIKM